MKPKALHIRRRCTAAFAAVLCAIGVSVVLPGCNSLDDHRIPVAEVYLPFFTFDDWNLYGIGSASALSYKRYIKSERIPANYSYKAIDRTGFGGLLLVGDVIGNPVVYDLSCPVECRQDVRVNIDPETHHAVCPKCGSAYDVFSLYGHPVSGVAADKGYGMRRYHVGPGTSGQYMVITF